MKRYVAIWMAAALMAIAGCGGGGNAEPDQALPVDEASPQAYTVDYLDAHPHLLVQPEHLLVVPLARAVDGKVQVRLHIREAMTLALASDASASGLSRIVIRDDAGVERGRHAWGNDAAQVSLQPGAHAIEFHVASGDGRPRSETIYLKLADAPGQAQQANQRPTQIGAEATVQDVRPLTTGVASGNNCYGCDFSGSDLSGLNRPGF